MFASWAVDVCKLQQVVGIGGQKEWSAARL